MENPITGLSANHVGETMKRKAPKIMRKNAPLLFGLLYSLCAILDVFAYCLRYFFPADVNDERTDFWSAVCRKNYLI